MLRVTQEGNPLSSSCHSPNRVAEVFAEPIVVFGKKPPSDTFEKV